MASISRFNTNGARLPTNWRRKARRTRRRLVAVKDFQSRDEAGRIEEGAEVDQLVPPAFLVERRRLCGDRSAT
jgi:hypothetical protein